MDVMNILKRGEDDKIKSIIDCQNNRLLMIMASVYLCTP